jgi:hypothetical protein
MSIRKCLHRWLQVTLIFLSLAPAIALAITDNGTLQVGKSPQLIAPANIYICTSGYINSLSLGSYSPTGLTGGAAMAALYDSESGTSPPACGNLSRAAVLRISGFSINPGQAWIASVACNGIAKTGASASSFNYSSGVAVWTWSSSFNLIGHPSGANVSCSVVHN